MFIIVSVVNERMVAIADGDLRKIENPKVKNIKHLQLTGKMAEEIAAILRRGELPGNHILRKYIRSLQGADESIGKEVW